ncbi:hypothetical protein CBR_g50835 [Chara braunii]|uniref:Uncharacterized protein n=1 Tax=Chara braunii TaxID=69332 RepID=A0A388M7N6_CHABU|nr:hypothetical protein CBR_g50835 [Chara braunii]|eukprot:GBG90489.1 hypothetical protein CBR_g50835 [Chara braunii]
MEVKMSMKMAMEMEMEMAMEVAMEVMMEMTIEMAMEMAMEIVTEMELAKMVLVRLGLLHAHESDESCLKLLLIYEMRCPYLLFLLTRNFLVFQVLDQLSPTSSGLPALNFRAGDELALLSLGLLVQIGTLRQLWGYCCYGSHSQGYKVALFSFCSVCFL